MRRIVVASLFLASLFSSTRADEPVVVTGKHISINGTAEIPADMFGVHAMPMKPEQSRDWGIELYRQMYAAPSGKPTMPDARNGLAGVPTIMDCQGDRYRAPLSLTDKNFAQTLAGLARDYAAALRAGSPPRHIVEFWNEPFLNWASRSDICYDVQYYDVAQAGADKPVLLKTTGKPAKFLKWRWALIGKDAKGAVHSRVSAPKNVKEGEAFALLERAVWKPFDRSGTYTAVWGWQVFDPTQVSYWSGRQNADYYNQMLVAYAPALKAAAPELPLIAGWSFNFRADNYEAWRILYQPTIDASIQWIDGINEHHYGTNSRALAADYELATGYAAGNHGKWLKVYNTESNGKVDPAIPTSTKAAATAPSTEEQTFRKAAGSYAYTLRDIMCLLEQVPDKAASRTAHSPTEAAWGAGGDEYAFKLLKPLRGKLVECYAPDRSLAVVSSINGNSLVVVVLNDSPQARTVPMNIDAPAGTTFAGGTSTQVTFNASARTLALAESPLAAQGVSFSSPITIADHNAVRLVLALEGKPAGAPQVVRRQYFAKEILSPVTAQAPLTLAIACEAEVLARATGARLRVVAQPLPKRETPPADVTAHPARTVTPVAGGAEAATIPASAPATAPAARPLAENPRARKVTINGELLTLPQGEDIAEIPIPLARLKAATTLTFSAGNSDARGYRVNIASIVIDAPR